MPPPRCHESAVGYLEKFCPPPSLRDLATTLQKEELAAVMGHHFPALRDNEAGVHQLNMTAGREPGLAAGTPGVE